MTGASKILTVSYGTFSCTLEGYDDPFNAMKAVAEYFRDFAAGDRSFGAEPPTPEAAVLHKIAEREIQRRVEAKISGNTVALRAEEGVPPRVTFPTVQSSAMLAPQPVPRAPTPVRSTVLDTAPAIESPAARLSRLRAAQARPVAAPTYHDAHGGDQAASYDQPDALATLPPLVEDVLPEPAGQNAEADLQCELAVLEAKVSFANLTTQASPTADTDTDTITAPAEDTSTPPILSEPRRLLAAKTDDISVNRLLQKANTELEVPETKRRRSAIAHLKAAVMATVAERRINPIQKPDLRMDPYRADLHQVVRQPERAAPLVLVSQQRIDRVAADTGRPPPHAVQPVAMPPASVRPVRPRRVTVAQSAAQTVMIDDEDDASDDVANVFTDPGKQTFQEFTIRLNATGLNDLIEAAAAYNTLVLGRKSFTRLQLFQHIQSLPGQPDHSREVGLRSFGRLIRTGRMTKINAKVGHYVLTATSPILTKAKRQVS